MKKLLCIVMAALLIMSGCSDSNNNQIVEEEDDFVIAASFYPVYITVLNIVEGVEGVSVKSLVGSQVGCLHDYTLTAAEMKTVEECDALVINGAGMEPFMDKISANIPALPVIDASEGIEIIKTHNEDNPHVWLDAENTILQLETITHGLCLLRPEYAAAFRENAARYKAELEELDEELANTLAPIAGAELVTFHEAFAYFAQAYGLEIAASIRRDEHTAPSSAEIEEVIDIMQENDIKAVFLEPQYQDNIAQTVADAADAQVYTLDPAVTGEPVPEAYAQAMRNNAQVLLEAF